MSGRFIKYWLPVIVWMCVIFSASTDLGNSNHSSRFFIPVMKWLFPHISESALGTAHLLFRKTGHLTEYAILGLLMFRAVRVEPWVMVQRTANGAMVLAILLCALYAASDETHQLFVSSREARVTDVFIDTVGATLGILVLRAFLRWRKRT